MSLPIHREGYPFIALFAGVNLLAFLIAPWLGLLLLPLTIWCIAFFRDPERTTPTAPGLIISPADGKLLPIVEAAPPPELGLGDAPRVRLSIFMNVFNVHVNRNPISGTVTGLAYRPGKFFNASFDKASVHNERMAIRLKPDGGDELVVVQIAGLVARRIVCELAQGQRVARGALWHDPLRQPAGCLSAGGCARGGGAGHDDSGRRNRAGGIGSIRWK